MPDGQNWGQPPAEQPPEEQRPEEQRPEEQPPGQQAGQTEGWGQSQPQPPAPEPGWGSLDQAWQVPGQPFGAAGSGTVSAPESLRDDLLPLSSARAASSPRHGARGWALMAIASAVVLVGAGTGASLVLAGATTGGGASSPAAAVQQMIDALNKSDVIGVLDNLDPGERNAIEPGLEDIFSQLERIGILSSTADLNDLTGMQISEQGLATSTDQLTPDVAAVTLSGGTNSEAIDPGQLPLGSYFQGLVNHAMNGRSVSTAGPNSGKTTLATVKVDGGWYVSLGYSIAINALRSSGQSGAPPASGPLQPVGASSPQGAVQALFTSVSQLDLTGLLADLDPEELAAVDAYAPDWLPSVQTALDKVQSQVSIQFGNLSLSTEPVDSGTLVKVGSGLTLSVKAHGMDLEYANGCYTVTGTNATEHECISSGHEYDPKLLALLPPAVQPIFERLTTMRPDTGFVTVDENGAWYVSPTRTYLNAISAELSLFEPGDIQTIIQNASGIGNAFEQYERQIMGGGRSFKLPSATIGTLDAATGRGTVSTFPLTVSNFRWPAAHCERRPKPTQSTPLPTRWPITLLIRASPPMEKPSTRRFPGPARSRKGTSQCRSGATE